MTKTVIIGLDGATWKNLFNWVQKKELPFLKKILDSGVRAKLRSTIPALTCPAIPSMITGQNPGELGIFDFRKPNGSLITYQDLSEKPFWDILGEKGIFSLIVNLRMTYPPKIKNGVMVSGILNIPSKDCSYVYPEKYKDLFSKFHGTSFDGFVGNIKKGSKTTDDFYLDSKDKYQKFRGIYQKIDPDLAFFWDGNPDRLQHFKWHEQNIILDFYKKLDKIIFKDVLELSKNKNIILVSDHGFGPTASFAFHINSWLERENYLYFNYFGATRWFKNLINDLYYRIGWKLRNNLPKRYYDIVFRLVKHFNKNGVKTKPIDNCYLENTRTKWLDKKRSLAYLDQKWGIKIIKENVRNYKEFREKLINKIKRIKTPAGEKIFKEVYKKEQVFKGKHLKYLPDIIILPETKFEIRTGLHQQLIKNISRQRLTTGAHENCREAIFVAIGPDIKQNTRFDIFDIEDIAPTIIHMHNVPIPTTLKGRVLKQIFRRDSELYKRNIEFEFRAKTLRALDTIKI